MGHLRRPGIGLLTLIVLLVLAACARGEISGQVLHFETHQPIQGARITLSRMPPPQGNLQTLVTDSSGRYRFGGLEQASYALEIEAQGYKPSNDLIELDASGPHQRDLLLFPDLPKYRADDKSLLRIPSQAELKSARPDPNASASSLR